MIQNNFTVLPFYSSLSQQHSNKPYAFGAVFPLIVDNRALIPFQVAVSKLHSTNNVLREAVLVNIHNSRNSVDITKILNSCVSVSTGSTHDIVVYTGSAVIAAKPGQYYLKLVLITGQTVYSEVITIVDNIDDYLKIVWWDEKNLVFDSGKIIYNSPAYKNILYLDTDIGKPDYKFEEDGKERDGYFFAEKQLSEKVYRFTFVAPEYLCDAIRFIRLSDNVQIYKNGIDYIVDSFLADVAWQEQGDLAAVDVEFRTNTVVKKIAAAWPK